MTGVVLAIVLTASFIDSVPWQQRIQQAQQRESVEAVAALRLAAAIAENERLRAELERIRQESPGLIQGPRAECPAMAPEDLRDNITDVTPEYPGIRCYAPGDAHTQAGPLRD